MSKILVLTEIVFKDAWSGNDSDIWEKGKILEAHVEKNQESNWMVKVGDVYYCVLPSQIEIIEKGDDDE